MFGKTVVIVVFLTLVEYASLQTVEDKSTLLNELKPQNKPTLENKSTQLDKVGDFIVNNGNAPKPPQRQIIRYLNCSDLHEYSLAEDTIQLSNLIIVAADNPCVIKASVIILKNNHFPAYYHAYNITGKKIVMVNNEFKGPEQNHYIVGDNVLVVNNKYQGSLQVHEVAGYEVTAFNNVFDGQYRVHKYAATSILVFDNESKGNPFYDIVMDDLPNFMHDSYPNDLSSHETGAFNDIRPQKVYSLGRTGPETFYLSSWNITRFLQEVKFGSNIKRPADATIVKKLEDFVDARLAQFQYLKNIDINERRIY